MRLETVQQLDATRREELSQWLRHVGEVGEGPRAGGWGACVEHDPRWLQVLQRGLGHQPLWLLARGTGGALRGVLPLALVRSRLFGSRLVSLPYLSRVGVVADGLDVRDRLVRQAAEIAQTARCRYVELRQSGEGYAHSALTYTRQDKQRMVLSLPADTASLMQQVGGKVRNLIRKGDRHDLQITWGGGALMRPFYAVFSRHMRDLGTPAYAQKLFRSLLEAFAEEAELAVVWHAGRPVATALLVHGWETSNGDGSGLERITLVPTACCLREANPMSANMWMYARLLERAIARGSVRFDFGRSTQDSGTWRFKKQWGAAPQPTSWQYHVLAGDPDELRPQHARFARAIHIWQRLPLVVTRCVGPVVVRGIP